MTQREQNKYFSETLYPRVKVVPASSSASNAATFNETSHIFPRIFHLNADIVH
jgi:hypothetical protein